ncbi:MAG: mandelate racemase/muconate lactonizing enzyme family protein [Candidatus Bathyarchaeia archaeon]
MSIVDVSSTVLKSYEYPFGGWLLVRIKTTDDVEGIGEAFIPNWRGDGVLAAKLLVDRGLKPLLVGEEALGTERLWERMYENADKLYDRRGLEIHAISGVDMALWDAAGKALKLPVHMLLGGLFREKVRVYASALFNMENPDVTVREAQRYVDQGFTAVKFGYGGFGYNHRRSVELVARLRETVGEETDLIVDGPASLNVVEAARLAKALERYNVYWYEEPLHRDDLEGYVKLTAEAQVPIAAGEGAFTRFDFKQLILSKAVDIVQPDVSWVGGLTEAKRIVELAHTWHTPFVPHNWGCAMNTYASIQLVASAPRGFLCEFPIGPRTAEAQLTETPSPMMTELPSEPIEVKRGYVEVPKTPGLGLELNEEAVKKYTYAG